MAPIPPGSLVLVTGVNGFIGSHIADQLLSAGFRVRGTVRSEAKAAWLYALFDKQYGKGKFEAVVVEDLSKEGAVDGAVAGVSGIAHVASDLSFSPDPNDVIPGVVASTTSLLRAAAAAPSVKRVVLTSSSTAATAPKPGERFAIDAASWNEEAVAEAWAPPPYEPARRWAVYGASKTQGEQAAWAFVRKEKPGFVFNAVLPNANFGPILSVKDQGVPSTAAWVKAVWDGQAAEVAAAVLPQYFVDVRDTARLHVAALAEPDVENERVFAFATPFNFNDILAVLRAAYPQHSVSGDIEGLGRDLSTVALKPRAEELLKRYGRQGFTGLEESVKETVESFRE